MLLIERLPLEKKEINQDVILLDLDERGHEPRSFLLFAGYITAVDHVFQDKKHYYTLSLPNEEIAELYKKLVKGAIGRSFSFEKLMRLHEALINGNAPIFSKLLEDFVVSVCSSHDLPHNDLERSLHLFVLGLLASLFERYVVKSNLESGAGRYDISLLPKKPNDPAILIEFKRGKDRKLEKLAEEALKQIRDNKYESLSKDLGYKGKVLCYGVATFKKQLVVKMETTHID